MPEMGIERVADEAVGRDRAVVGEPVVVRLHHRQVRVVVGDLLEEAAGEDGHEEQLGVDAVFVLLVQTLHAVAGAVGARAVVLEVALARELHLAAARAGSGSRT